MKEVDEGPEGSFFIDRERASKPALYVRLPKDSMVSRLPLYEGEGIEHSWRLRGTDDKPTLNPSINAVGVWHGWLTDGRFTEC